MSQTPHFVDALDEQSVATLSTMIGKEWCGFYAWEAPAARNHYSAWEVIGLQLRDECVRIKTDFLDLPLFDDFDDDVGHLSVDTVTSWSSRQEDVVLHQKFVGQRIHGISVVRVHVRYLEHNQLQWTLATEWGVVLTLDSGVVAVVKGVYQGFHLTVLTADSFESLDVRGATKEWNEEDPESAACGQKW